MTELLEVLQQDEIFKSSDVRDAVLSPASRQQRVAALLDRLETRGDRTFLLFMDALREHYRHLHSVMEETLRSAVRGVSNGVIAQRYCLYWQFTHTLSKLFFRL